ncbi:hypothetical protein IWQ60_006380 [Tieghemiomyces parasiticus]|uniref:Uncharacterized protein n=1 Tax=Tieghemiomyces parasiticus TaxID=78921 RepID=A0A9W8AAK3_9FUNG|nr:hypothetical protein IWQ60_006380 [Tieghemiomyces parasiticus]
MLTDFDNACLTRDLNDSLVSYDGTRFVEFLALVVVAGPVAYRSLSWLYDWERDRKSWVDHFHDTAQAIMYSFIVFVLGNYARTLSWWTVLGYFIGLFGWALLGELPFMKVSLPTWRSWSPGAWALHLFAVGAVLTLAVFHCLWAFENNIFWPWYLVGLIIATSFIWIGVVVSIIERRVIIPWRIQRHRTGPSHSQSSGSSLPGWSGGNTAGFSTAHPLASTVNQSPAATSPHAPNMAGGIGLPMGPDYPSPANAIPLQQYPTVGQPEAGHTPGSAAVHGANDSSGRPTLTINKEPLSSTHGSPSTQSSAGYNDADAAADLQRSLTSSTGTTPAAPRTHLVCSGKLNSRLTYWWRLIDPLAHLRRRLAERDAAGTLDPNLYRRFSVHLHHWQIFYILAFFTRFPHTVSQISAGLVLGIFTHGGAAYGFDSLLEVDETATTSGKY